jgi:hypothetical protein
VEFRDGEHASQAKSAKSIRRKVAVITHAAASIDFADLASPASAESIRVSRGKRDDAVVRSSRPIGRFAPR